MKSYLIHFGKEPVGKVRVSRQGLYYCFQCRCNPSEDTVARLIVANGSFSENLGILVPMGNGFGLDTRRPVKLFTNEEFCDNIFLSYIVLKEHKFEFIALR